MHPLAHTHVSGIGEVCAQNVVPRKPTCHEAAHYKLHMKRSGDMMGAASFMESAVGAVRICISWV
jgi:hypothetical protein